MNALGRMLPTADHRQPGVMSGPACAGKDLVRARVRVRVRARVRVRVRVGLGLGLGLELLGLGHLPAATLTAERRRAPVRT